MYLLICIILLPIVSALLTPVLNINRLAYHLLIGLAAAISFVLLLYLPHDGRVWELNLFTGFMLDKYGWFFVLLVNLAWLITIIYSYSFGHFEPQTQKKRFYFLLHVKIAVLIGNGLAGNLITLFAFYLIGIPIAYPLFIFTGTKAAYRSGKIFLLHTLLPALFIFLPAIGIIYYISGSFDFNVTHYEAIRQNTTLASLLIAMFVIGISKNSVFPFHNWLPQAIAMPTPAIALLNAVGTTKSGAIALVKIVVYIFGAEYVTDLSQTFMQTGWLIYLCGFTALNAAINALKTNNLNARFSYSTVSQLSYIIISILIGTPAAILGAMLHIFSHAIAKICLFYVAGYYNSVHKMIHVGEIRKIAPQTKQAVIVIAICGLSIIGFPFLAGYYGKDQMLLEEIHTHHYSAALMLIIGSIINVLYILPIVKALFYADTIDSEVKPIPPGMVIAILICVLGIITSSVYIYYIINELSGK
jgi:multicomponent Na+:H+ antiporter subunit D